MATRELFQAAAELLRGARKIIISGHLSPDGDSLGCMLAMTKMLRNAGFEAYAAADQNALGKLSFLEGTKDLLPLRKLKRIRKVDLFIAVDCGVKDRLPPEARPLAEKVPVLCFDHHVTGDAAFAKVAIIDSSASSAAEIVWRFAKWMEWTFNRDIAEALWVAMVTDTGRFAYDSTKPGTMRAAGDLLKHDVRTALINDIIYGTFPSRAIALKRIAWRSLHIWKNRRVAEVSLSRDDFRSVRGTKADAEDIIEIPRSVARNEIALAFYQIPDRTKETRCSIRTRGDWDATVLAGKFGGGGHRKAAGCTIKAPMGVAKRQMRAAVKEMLKGACRKTLKIDASKLKLPATPPAAEAKPSTPATTEPKQANTSPSETKSVNAPPTATV